MSAFAEVRFEAGYIIYGTEGGAEFNTDIVVYGGGNESRNSNWGYAKGQWNFGDRKMPDSELKAIVNFFRARKGRAQGFRFKDWGDYEDWGAGVLGLTGLGDGATLSFQLVKNYASSSDTDQRLIQKPVAGTVKVYKDAVLQTSGYTLDTTTGLVLFSVAPSNGSVLTWTGEFDCPVRFDVDVLKYRFESAVVLTPGTLSTKYFYVSTLPLVEVRV